MKLSEKLKSIYSSENTYTVLQLLQKMIEAVEEAESLYNLYEHILTVQAQGVSNTITIKVVTTSPNKFHYVNGPLRYKSDGKIVSIVTGDQILCTTFVDTDSLLHYYAMTDSGLVERTYTILSEEVTAL